MGRHARLEQTRSGSASRSRCIPFQQLITPLIGGTCLFVTFLSAVEAQDTHLTSSGLGTQIASPRVDGAQSYYDITGGVRPQNGKNLFHSFGRFEVGENAVAHFVNDRPHLPTANILSRVTGGRTSKIFGTINTTDFPDANFFLLNPAGILFGPGAKLEVAGSFHASTADRIRLGDGVMFETDFSPNVDARLSIAPPQAFGFLDRNAAPIAIEGSQLGVPEANTLSFIGGDLTITESRRDDGTVVNSKLSVERGQINLVSTASPGEVFYMATDGGLQIKSNEPLELGVIRILGNSAVSVSNGAMSLLGDQLLIKGQGAILEAPVEEGALSANLGISVDARNTIEINQGRIQSINNSDGNAGDVLLKAAVVTITNEGKIRTDTRKSGDAGSVRLEVARLALSEGAEISSDSRSRGGTGGEVTVVAEERVDILSASRLTSDTRSDAAAGRVIVSAPNIRIEDRAIIQATSSGEGRAGDITLNVNRLEMDREARISNKTTNKGDGETVTINGFNNGIATERSDIQLKDQSSISALSENEGNAGSITITNADTVRLLDESEMTVTTNRTDADAGDITIKAKALVHLRNSAIKTSAAVIDEQGTGQGGHIVIDPKIVVLDSASEIVANASKGEAGNITIRITGGGSLFQSTDSVIEASNNQNISGSIVITRTDSDIIEGTLVLPEAFLDIGSVLRERCAARTAAGASSFVVSGRSGMPPGPDAFLPDYVSDLDQFNSVEPRPETTSALPKPNNGKTHRRLRRLVIECPAASHAPGA